MNNDRIVMSEVSDVKDIIQAIDLYQKGVIAIVDKDDSLLGIVTDGDIRKALLYGEISIDKIVNAHPFVLKIGTPQNLIINKLLEIKSFVIPLVDNNGKFVRFFFMERGYKYYDSSTVVIMAGGLGSRLGELTKNTPKPMLKLGNCPILEHIMKSFKEYGFVNFIICVNYKSNIIREYFKNGDEWGVNVTYVEESKRLGTGGALSLVKEIVSRDFFVINGDVLSTVNYSNLLLTHQKSNSWATMCLRKMTYQIPYGVVDTDNSMSITSIIEKPVNNYYINTGIYVLNSDVLAYIPDNTYYDLPNLFIQLKNDNKLIKGYEITDYWLDLGRKEDYFSVKKKFEV